MFAYDDKSAVVVMEETGLQCAVPGRTLLELLDGAGEEIEMVLMKKHEHESVEHLEIKDGTSTMKLPVLGKDAFVFDIPDCEVDCEIELDEELCEVLGFVADCANVETIQPQFMGVAFRLDKRLHVYSTDNVTITRMVTKQKYEGKGSAVIPSSSVQLLTKVYQDLGADLTKATMSIGPEYVVVQYEVKDTAVPVIVVCKTIATKPADYEKMLQEHLSDVPYVPMPDGLELALKRSVAVLGDDMEHKSEIGTEGKRFWITTKGTRGQIGANLKLSESDGRSAASLNISPKHFLRALRACAEMKVRDALILRGSFKNFTIDHLLSAAEATGAN